LKDDHELWVDECFEGGSRRFYKSLRKITTSSFMIAGDVVETWGEYLSKHWLADLTRYKYSTFSFFVTDSNKLLHQPVSTSVFQLKFWWDRRSRDSSVGITTRLLARRPRNRGSIAWKSLDSLGPTQHPIQMGIGACSPGLKRLERKADHLPQYSAEVKNRGAIPPYSHTSLLPGA
jgi:hypothetical protein